MILCGLRLVLDLAFSLLVMTLQYDPASWLPRAYAGFLFAHHFGSAYLLPPNQDDACCKPANAGKCCKSSSAGKEEVLTRKAYGPQPISAAYARLSSVENGARPESSKATYGYVA